MNLIISPTVHTKEKEPHDRAQKKIMPIDLKIRGFVLERIGSTPLALLSFPFSMEFSFPKFEPWKFKKGKRKKGELSKTLEKQEEKEII